MLRSRIGVVRLLLCGLALTWAGAASALSFTMADVPFVTSNGSTGTIELVGGSQGAGGTGTTLSGAAGGSDDLLIFRVVMSSGSVVEVGVGLWAPFPILPVLSTASGTIAGADVDVVNGTLTTTGPTLRTFSFSASPLSGTSDQFWVTTATSLSDGDTVAFMVNDGTGQVTVLGTINLPEPSTLALLGAGLLALAGTRLLRG